MILKIRKFISMKYTKIRKFILKNPLKIRKFWMFEIYHNNNHCISVDFIYTGIEIISDLSNLLPAFAIMNKKLRK